ncbi:MAG: hypothetical protein IPM98_17915 [Lewinellaceae bacterium]|nr:hypothetical protein [Lewinellaceae bacterium]
MIEVTDFLKRQSVFPLPSFAKQRFKMGDLQKRPRYIEAHAGVPDQPGVRTVKTYKYRRRRCCRKNTRNHEPACRSGCRGGRSRSTTR